MNKEIENIIKKNLPEKRELKECGKCNACEMMMSCEVLYADRQFNQALSQIDTSLIADEVLKIIKPKIESIYKNLCLYHCAEHKLLKKEIKELLSNLFPNKENENNEIHKNYKR